MGKTLALSTASRRRRVDLATLLTYTTRVSTTYAYGTQALMFAYIQNSLSHLTGIYYPM